ncbi:MAG: F0F1 ATP synthase subunit gamma [bacterium]|nr:F0F1 ATP synthase subunit gamma [bacterium]
MDQATEITERKKAMETLVGLTNVFESIASLKITEVKSQVLQSKIFFAELWNIYKQIRVSEKFGANRAPLVNAINKDLIIIVTAEGGFSGDIDEKLINLMIQEYQPNQQDIIVIGHHGAIQLVNQGIKFKKYYKLPQKDRDINVGPIIAEVSRYRTTKVYYQTYVSLLIQDVKRIELGSVVQEESKKVKTEGEVISERTYIFEPTPFAVIDHLEKSMLYIALEQVILESKLAHYASRFRAMSGAHERAEQTLTTLRTQLNAAKRATKDRRQKEILSGFVQAGAM